jgi:hypothetical protein
MTVPEKKYFPPNKISREYDEKKIVCKSLLFIKRD